MFKLGHQVKWVRNHFLWKSWKWIKHGDWWWWLFFHICSKYSNYSRQVSIPLFFQYKTNRIVSHQTYLVDSNNWQILDWSFFIALVYLFLPIFYTSFDQPLSEFQIPRLCCQNRVVNFYNPNLRKIIKYELAELRTYWMKQNKKYFIW